MQQKITLFWFRRDLRLDDNAALFHALRSGAPVLPVFIFDSVILDRLEDKADKRLVFIHQQLELLHLELQKYGSTLVTRNGKPLDAWKELLNTYSVHAVYANHDYEPYARERDDSIKHFLNSRGIPFHTFKDQVIFEKNEVLKENETPYTVFTPYGNKWKSKLSSFFLKPYPCENYFRNFFKTGSHDLISLAALGFRHADLAFSGKEFIPSIIKNYHLTRNIPAQEATSRLGIHLRFGTISIRKLAAFAQHTNEAYLNELAWREFFMQVLWHFPRVVNESFKKKYDTLPWRNNEKEFEAWCSGTTGYPMVDAGMRELNATGFMHNRARMITASFLCKHLLIDWRWGESWFAKKLLDFELSSNNGNWQWAAGTGCDAAPYFRIFNPIEQARRFDPENIYIKKWVPEFEHPSYPRPMVDHAFARERCLKVYRAVREF